MALGYFFFIIKSATQLPQLSLHIPHRRGLTMLEEMMGLCVRGLRAEKTYY